MCGTNIEIKRVILKVCLILVHRLLKWSHHVHAKEIVFQTLSLNHSTIQDPHLKILNVNESQVQSLKEDTLSKTNNLKSNLKDNMEAKQDQALMEVIELEDKCVDEISFAKYMFLKRLKKRIWSWLRKMSKFIRCKLKFYSRLRRMM